MLSTLLEAKNGALADIAGVCTSGEKFLSLVNEATRRLMSRGDWVGTVVPIQVCAYAGCVVFPKYVGSVREISICNRPISIRNNWYAFMDFPLSQYRNQCAGTCSSRPMAMIGATNTPTFRSIVGAGRYVRVYVRTPDDVGKTLTIYGIGNDGQPLMQLVNGAWIDGHTITLDNPYGSSSVYVSRIDRVLKDSTSNIVDMFAYNPATDTLEQLATYDMEDTNPSFVGYNLPSRSTCNDEVLTCLALVKLRFVPAKNDTDLVMIENLYALKDMIQSLKEKEAGNIAVAIEYEKAAIRELNMDLRNNNPDQQISIDIKGFGNSFPARKGIGRIF